MIFARIACVNRPARSRRIVLGAALCFGCTAAQSQPVAYALDPEHTRVHWEVLHYGTSTIRGRFDRLRGSVTLDRAARSGDVSISVDTASVSTGVPALDRVLRGNNFFMSNRHPQAYFVSRELRLDGERVNEVRGEVTLRGTNVPLSLRALSFSCRTHPVLQREVCGGDFEGELAQSAFGMTYGLSFTSDRVRLLIQVEAVRIDP
jgi:polyisoprenoid-binding protein YceI